MATWLGAPTWALTIRGSTIAECPIHGADGVCGIPGSDVEVGHTIKMAIYDIISPLDVSFALHVDHNKLATCTSSAALVLFIAKFVFPEFCILLLHIVPHLYALFSAYFCELSLLSFLYLL